MKKILLLILVALLLLSLGGCAEPSSGDSGICPSQTSGCDPSTAVPTAPSTTTVPPTEPSVSLPQPNGNLEFWITDNVDDFDFSGFQEKYGMFGGQQFYGTGYCPILDEYDQQTDPAHCVIYTVTSYPDYADAAQHITGIYITDPNVEFYGIRLGTSFAEIESILTGLGYTVTVSDTCCRAEMSNIWITVTAQDIYIGAQVTNESGIIF